MPPRRTFSAAVYGMLLVCLTSIADAQYYPQYYPSTSARRIATEQQPMTRQYRVEPAPMSPYMMQRVVAPSYNRYGNSYTSGQSGSPTGQIETVPTGPMTTGPMTTGQGTTSPSTTGSVTTGPVQLSPIPQVPNQPTPTPRTPASYTDRLATIEAELDMLRSTTGAGMYSPSRTFGNYAPSHGGISADVAFVFAQPSFTDSSNYGTYNAPADLSRAYPFHYDYQFAPRVSLGYTGAGGRGVRARYWHFDHAGHGRQMTQTDAATIIGADWIHPWGMITALTNGVGQTMTITNSIKAEALDLEVTQALDFARTEITFSGGLRYAYLEKHFNAVIPGVDFLTARHDFEGFGPTIATEIRLPCSFWADDPCDPCGQCDPCDPCACTPCGGWALYGGGRYSILFGHSWAYGENGTDPFHYRLTEVMSIGEIELGAEWTGPTPVGGMFLFRVGYEGQVWYEAGSPSNVGGDLGFRGVNLKFGIEY